MANMTSGYAFETDPRESGDNYFEISNDEWEIVVYTPNGREIELGCVNIDGARCTVFSCADGMYRAQMSHMVTS